jgi:putative ABC transport system permease protein
VRALRSACNLAFHDWKHDGLLSLCSVLALVSILAPLLILLGIRNGVIASLKTRLLDNPALLTVSPAGSGNGYPESWLDSLRARPDVAFVIPKTRDISTTVQMRHDVDGAPRFSPVDVEPTGTGDPLLARFEAVPAQRNMITLSRTAAERLAAQKGSRLTAQLGRTTASGKIESLPLELDVAAVLPLEAESRAIGFILLPLLVDIEEYKDGFAVPDLGADGDPSPRTERRFARFRLYARTMDDVAVLRDFFTNQGIEVHTQAMEIKSFQEISQALTVLFALIAGTVAAGFVASTASSVLAGVRRKDKQLGMLRLLGFSGAAIMAFPLIQAQLTALCGCALAAGFYACAGYALDALFSEKFYGAAVSLLPPEHFALIAAGVCAASLLACLPAARRAARIEPCDVLREI